jgi:hypothetical protein
MGWGFRRSIKLGPLKLNLSKSGIGYSVGVRGFRVGKDAKGRSYTSASIPGTGLYSRNYPDSAQRPASPGAMTPEPIGTEQRSGGNGRAVVLAFLAGGVLTLILVGLFSSRPTPLPAPAPAAVSAPVAPAQPIPVKRRRTGKKTKRARPIEGSGNTAGSEEQLPARQADAPGLPQ